jgi:hypothetical protein
VRGQNGAEGVKSEGLAEMRRGFRERRRGRKVSGQRVRERKMKGQKGWLRVRRQTVRGQMVRGQKD